MYNNKIKKNKKESQDQVYEPDWKDLQAHEELMMEWRKDHPDWTDEDAADYYAQLQIDIARGK